MDFPNIRGVTFDYRLQTAADMGVILRAAFGKKDGILQGCDISTPTLNGVRISKGDVLICGRHICIEEDAVIPTNGFGQAGDKFARLILQIDLDDTATDTDFDQVSIRFEYATNVSNFTKLTQEDINRGGRVYEVEMCVVTLDDTFHPTGVVRKWQNVAPMVLVG